MQLEARSWKPCPAGRGGVIAVPPPGTVTPVTGAAGEPGFAMLGAVGICCTVPSGVSGERKVGMVETVDEPRLTGRCAAFGFGCAGRAWAGRVCAGGGAFTRLGGGARRVPGSGCMIENGKSSWVCATAPVLETTARTAGKAIVQAAILNQFCILLIQNTKRLRHDRRLRTCMNARRRFQVHRTAKFIAPARPRSGRTAPHRGQAG